MNFHLTSNSQQAENKKDLYPALWCQKGLFRPV